MRPSHGWKKEDHAEEQHRGERRSTEPDCDQAGRVSSGRTTAARADRQSPERGGNRQKAVRRVAEPTEVSPLTSFRGARLRDVPEVSAKRAAKIEHDVRPEHTTDSPRLPALLAGRQRKSRRGSSIRRST